MKHRALTPFHALLALAACGGPPAPPAPSEPSAEAPAPASASDAGAQTGSGDLVAALARTACFGFCPIYRVEIYGDGRVLYRGERFVVKTGEHEGKIDAAALAELRRAFADIRFWDLKDAYDDHSMTDMPGAELTYREGGREKTVRHYHGYRTAPEALGKLEDEVDRIADIDQFIGTRQERDALRSKR